MSMKTTTAIFDMDGLLIDSEPLWYEAAQECLTKFGITIDEKQYVETTGLRTKNSFSIGWAYSILIKPTFPLLKKKSLILLSQK